MDANISSLQQNLSVTSLFISKISDFRAGPQSFSPPVQSEKIDISPVGGLKNLLQSGISQASVDIDYSAVIRVDPNSQNTLDSEFTKIEGDLDLILRIIARDDVDYTKLKECFKGLYILSQKKAKDTINARVGGNTARINISLNGRKTDRVFEINNVSMQTAEPVNSNSDSTFGSIEINPNKTGNVLIFNKDIKRGASTKANRFAVHQKPEKITPIPIRQDPEEPAKIINIKDAQNKALGAYRNNNISLCSESKEVVYLQAQDIKSINLEFQGYNTISNNNKLLLKGNFTNSKGQKKDIVDALMGYK